MSGRPAIWGAQHAAAFEDADVARRYRFRAPYAEEAISQLVDLIDPACRTVLDLGAGTGDIARRIAPHAARVDAVDPSAPMMDEGRRLPGGTSANIRWILARAEEVDLDGPYGLATAGSSLHWMEWDIVLPRVARALGEHAVLAILDVRDPLLKDEGPVLDAVKRYSAYAGTYVHVDLIAELERRGRFSPRGEATFERVASQTIEEYIDGLHSASALSAARIGPQATRALDDEIRRCAPRDARGMVTRRTTTQVVWGRPS